MKTSCDLYTIDDTWLVISEPTKSVLASVDTKSFRYEWINSFHPSQLRFKEMLTHFDSRYIIEKLNRGHNKLFNALETYDTFLVTLDGCYSSLQALSSLKNRLIKSKTPSEFLSHLPSTLRHEFSMVHDFIPEVKHLAHNIWPKLVKILKEELDAESKLPKFRKQ